MTGTGLFISADYGSTGVQILSVCVITFWFSLTLHNCLPAYQPTAMRRRSNRGIAKKYQHTAERPEQSAETRYQAGRSCHCDAANTREKPSNQIIWILLGIHILSSEYAHFNVRSNFLFKNTTIRRKKNMVIYSRRKSGTPIRTCCRGLKRLLISFGGFPLSVFCKK